MSYERYTCNSVHCQCILEALTLCGCYLQQLLGDQGRIVPQVWLACFEQAYPVYYHCKKLLLKGALLLQVAFKNDHYYMYELCLHPSGLITVWVRQTPQLKFNQHMPWQFYGLGWTGLNGSFDVTKPHVVFEMYCI